jgi:hypothetical protein
MIVALALTLATNERQNTMSKKVKTSSVEVSDAAIALQSAIAANFETIEKSCDAATVSKYKKESSRYSVNFCAAIVDKLSMTANDFAFMLNVEQTNKRIAIYAMQKVTKLLNAIVNNYNASYCDKFTRAVLVNLRVNDSKSLSNYMQRASMTHDLKLEDESSLRQRAYAAVSTADTQRSSTAIALHALKLANYDAKERSVKLDKSCANSTHMRKLLDKIEKSVESSDDETSDDAATA